MVKWFESLSKMKDFVILLPGFLMLLQLSYFTVIYYYTYIYHIIYVIISLHEIRYYCVFGYYYCCIYIRTYICKTYTCNYNTMCCIYMICKLTYIYNCICVDIVVSYTYNVLQPSLRLPGDGVFSTPTRVVLTIQFPLGWKLKMVVPSRSNSLVGGFKYFF